MRVTFHTAFGSLDYISAAADQTARARQQVQSGKRLEKPSDDPAAMQRSIEVAARSAPSRPTPAPATPRPRG
jgi:flagellin-like hook-associated protein FlgL